MASIKCAHETCNCDVESEADVEMYCNDYCEGEGTGDDGPCQCGHVECAV